MEGLTCQTEEPGLCQMASGEGVPAQANVEDGLKEGSLAAGANGGSGPSRGDNGPKENGNIGGSKGLLHYKDNYILSWGGCGPCC